VTIIGQPLAGAPCRAIVAIDPVDTRVVRPSDTHPA